jgi:O-acetyl-ADP-ribose deacetylase (regulator of RNase III)
MPIIYRQGNVLEADLDVIGHGANCQICMGAGIARQIKNKFPEVYEADKRCSLDKGLPRLGTYSKARSGKYLFYNLYTQENPHPPVSYAAISSSLDSMKKDLMSWNIWPRVGLPLIGAGLGGGDWLLIERIINEIFFNREVFVYYLDKKPLEKDMEKRV